MKNVEVTGNVGPTYFGFTGTVGVTISVDLKCGGTVTLNSWCSRPDDSRQNQVQAHTIVRNLLLWNNSTL